MSAVTMHDTTVQGFQALALSNGLVGYTIVPDLGGKIASLRDERTGREWLWTNPALPYRCVAYDASYVAEADVGGWDECFPSVSPCRYPAAPWQGLPVPDHGELWSQRAAVQTATTAPAGLALTTTIDGVAFPYTFSRTIALEAESAALRVAYTLRNRGAHDFPFIWSAHPLLPLEPGMRVQLPADTWVVVNEHGRAGDVPAPGEYTWPLFEGGALPGPASGCSLKLWTRPLSDGWVTLATLRGALRITFDLAASPQVGLWINAGAWSGTGGAPYNNVGLEPCIGAQDSLADAVERHNLYGILPAGGTRAWQMTIELQAA